MHPLALALRKIGEILHGFGSVLFEQAANDIAFRSIEDCVGAGLTWHRYPFKRIQSLGHWIFESLPVRDTTGGAFGLVNNSMNQAFSLLLCSLRHGAWVSACALGQRALSFRLLAE